MKRLRRKKIVFGGFTLLEMICVISIIGILTTLAVPQITKYIDKANETKIISAVTELNNTAILMQAENKSKLEIGEIIKEVGSENLGVNMQVGSSSFKVGKFVGTFNLENEKVVANVTEPQATKYTLNGKL
ncbi:prepilin-type N-terminal cleavage/methylation domain-containing protein [Pseudostreptobacillus hongkongensis]|uniref:prepilin-type N-terminal cleavage/methylation domain-containing protein n=1 Tax=Pseudostreptobacillus hongkongensis TaxID=1162717 RepID=UPI0009E8D626|nr:prepilin-type N-terminal cleavage/methylation domain-containing protein [Pseudostreptobacillus hongkongensis]